MQRFSQLALNLLLVIAPISVATGHEDLAATARLQVRRDAIDGQSISIPLPVGRAIPSTLDTTLAEVDSAKKWGQTVICFLGTECPLARLYGPRLTQMAKEFLDDGVQFIAVFSNVQDATVDVQKYMQTLNVQMPAVRDDHNLLADAYGAERTPEIFVLDHSFTVRYRGRVDDQYQPGVSRAEPTRHDLRNALHELIQGRDVSVAETKATGCFIGRVRESTESASQETTYCNQIARILNRHCVECHRQGEIGPFALDDYDEVVGWIDTMIEVIEDQRMPPWHANPEHGDFINARNFPSSDLELLRQWLQAGTPYGDPDNLPEPPQFASGWQMQTQPDVEFAMRKRPFEVPADGVVEYQYFVVDPAFEEDRWVAEAEVIPGNHAVVHHVIVFIRPPDGVDLPGVGWLTAYVPGQRTVSMPHGYARRVPAGSKLVFQMHYTPNGTAQSDMTKIGVKFIDEADVTHEVITLIGINQDFEIPPGDDNYQVTGETRWVPQDGLLVALAPHMHFRGKSFRILQRRSEGESVLLDVPQYDFNWQHSYRLKDHLPLRGVAEIAFTATFDNSSANPFNPDPTRTVTWGDQTWEEMAVAFYEVAVPLKSEGITPPKQPSLLHTKRVKVAEFVHEFFTRLDKNKDGVVKRHETTFAVRRFTLPLYDKNGDGVVTEDEVRQVAEEELRRG